MATMTATMVVAVVVTVEVGSIQAEEKTGAAVLAVVMHLVVVVVVVQGAGSLASRVVTHEQHLSAKVR